MASFMERLAEAWDRSRSLLCVGLDPDPRRMPVRDVAEFNATIIEVTADLVCAYKPNLAFYEALGLEGLRALEHTIRRVQELAPHAVIIGDGKRGDVPTSAEAYARAMFDGWGFDAVTVNAYGGADAVAPFLAREDRGAFVWCRSSNPGGAEVQDLRVLDGDSPTPLYLWLARRAARWPGPGTVGLVVGATYPRELAQVRRECPEAPLLVPGVGTQGGALEGAVRLGADGRGRGLIINASRSILYASSRRADYAAAARRAAEDMRDAIARTLHELGRGWTT